MAAPCSKAEYLKKYLSVNAEEKKKKRRKKPGVPAKILKSRIVDDDVEFSSLLPENLSNTLEEDVGDNEPLIADFIDERPEHVQLLEKYRKSGAWKILGQDEADADSNSSYGRLRHDSDSDKSPVRKQRHDSDSDQSPVRKQRHDTDSDQSPVRKQRHDSDSDQSPVRKQRHDSDQSPPRRKRHDSDNSPTRKASKTNKNKSFTGRRRNDSDSDQSLPRRGDKNKKHYSDSDQSPPRRRNILSKDSFGDLSPPRKQKRRGDSDSDYSRSRKHFNSRNDKSGGRPVRHRQDSGSDLSPPRSSSKNKSQNGGQKTNEEKTLSGKRAGLSSAQEMRREAEELKRKENEKFKQISDERLGKGAETIFRDKSGKKRNLAEERRKETEEAKVKAKEDEKYQNWGKGLKQIERQTQQVEEAIHEVNKPLARYKDDDDLDDMLRNMDRAEDPMLAFITKKKTKTTGPPVKEKPRYKGPAPPPNRFGIMPGYRWDSVNRSNGFEKQVSAKQAERMAVADQAYKWSVEDM